MTRAPSRGEVSALLLLAAVAWCSATAGGAGTRDFAVATALVVAARVAAHSPSSATARSWSIARPGAGTLVFLTLIGWLFGVGIAERAALADVVRLPWLVCVVTLAAATARRMPARHQETVMAALAVLGASLAVIGAWQWLTLAVWTDVPLTSIRADAPLGYPNALGALVLATALLTYRALPRFGQPGVALLVLQLGAALATGSRLVMLIGTAVACTYVARGRDRWLRVVAAMWTMAASIVLVFRFATVPPERLHLWAGALRTLGTDAITGRGPSPEVIDTGSTPVRPTTHAHNEVLQLALEYGLAGVLLAGAAVYLAVRLGGAAQPPDWPLLLAIAALAALAVTDFALRIPAVALTLATLAGIVSGRPQPVGADPCRGRVVGTRDAPSAG